MKFLENLLTRLQSALFSLQEEKIKEQTFLCLFLKYNTDFMFIAPTKTDSYESKNFRPLILPLSLGKIEDNFFMINDFMMNEFDISPDRIQIAKEFVSLFPIKSQTYYFAIIDISKEDVVELKKKNTFGYFSNLPLPYISLKADNNFFFQIILKLVTEQPYIMDSNFQTERGKPEKPD